MKWHVIRDADGARQVGAFSDGDKAFNSVWATVGDYVDETTTSQTSRRTRLELTQKEWAHWSLRTGTPKHGLYLYRMRLLFEMELTRVVGRMFNNGIEPQRLIENEWLVVRPGKRGGTRGMFFGLCETLNELVTNVKTLRKLDDCVIYNLSSLDLTFRTQSIEVDGTVVQMLVTRKAE